MSAPKPKLSPSDPGSKAPRHRAGRYVVARVDDIPEGGRIIVDLDGHSIGVFNVGGKFHALLNHCPHKGAALCQGEIVNQVESSGPGDVELNDGTTFIACPWHGWEYDLATGQSWFDPRRSRVRAYAVDVATGDSVEGGLADRSLNQIDQFSCPPDGLKGRVKGPFVAKSLPISIEAEYLVVSLKSIQRSTIEGKRNDA